MSGLPNYPNFPGNLTLYHQIFHWRCTLKQRQRVYRSGSRRLWHPRACLVIHYAGQWDTIQGGPKNRYSLYTYYSYIHWTWARDRKGVIWLSYTAFACSLYLSLKCLYIPRCIEHSGPLFAEVSRFSEHLHHRLVMLALLIFLSIPSRLSKSPYESRNGESPPILCIPYK